jgi:hypothetical protein
LTEIHRPTTTTDPQTGAELPTTEPWIWFLISRPILTLSATDTSTRPRPAPNTDSPSTPELRSTSSTSSKYYTPSTQPSPDQNPIPTSYPTAPPNFPHPYPTSWLVFACPTAHVTSYPSIIETPSTSSNPTNPLETSASTQTQTIKPNYPFLRSTTTTTNNSSRRGSHKKIHKRKDFDFSHQGTPLFEFSSVDLFPTNGQTEAQARSFLSVENLGRFFGSEDEWEECSDEEYKFVVQQWEDNDYRLGTTDTARYGSKGGGDGDGDRCGVKDGDRDEGHEREKELPSPYKGLWWKCFYEAMYRDAARWNRVRLAMGMGMCRVVVRWVDYQPNPITSASEGMKGAGEGMIEGEDAEMSGMG